jgi:predicted ATPase/DNA-binding SARP family transcriptional activator
MRQLRRNKHECTEKAGAPQAEGGHVALLTTGRLPVRLVPLVGRQRELGGVVDALSQGRLLTLTGPGGTGKTRLALAAAEAARAAGGRAVCWVELAPIDDPAVIALTVAGELGTRETPGRDVVDTIAEHVGDRPVLLVLDNCEHVTAAAAELAGRLLAACPALTILATSREVLGVDGERQLPIPPLALPPNAATPVAAELAEFDAIRFFEQRAQLAVPGFRLADDNAAAVHQVCRRLDGLPLAIELAAARLRILSATQLAERLDDVFAVLVGGARTAPRRHQTLRATLDWSHDLLDDDERAVFRRLAVFAGGFTLAAAEQVAASDDIPPRQVLDLLTRLADKSLVRVERTGRTGPAGQGGAADGDVRYHLLATVRDYARERLAAAAEQDRTRRAHLRFFAQFVEQVEPRIGGGEVGPVDLELELNRIEAETPNIRAALEFARAAGETPEALRITGPLERYAYLRGQYSEVRRWMDSAVTIGPDAPAVLLAKALLGSGRLALLQCDYPTARARLAAALELYRQLSDASGIARALQVTGSVAREQGQYDRSVALHAEGLALATTAGDQWTAASAHNYIGFASWLRRDYARATAECDTALTMFRGLGDVEGIVWALLSQGIVARYQGDPVRAAELLEQSRARSEGIGFREGIAWSLEQLGLLAAGRGEPEAGRLLRRSLDLHRELRDQWRTCSVLDDLAALALTGNDAEQAARLLGAAAALREAIGTVVAPCEQDAHDRTAAGARTALGDAGFDAAWQHGAASSIDDLLTAPVPASSPPRPRAAGARAEPDKAGNKGAATAGPLRIRALGTATVHIGETPVTAADWGYAKPRELLFLLVTSPPLTRDQVGVALWPDQSRQQLGNALHTALRGLRRALGDPEWVQYADGRYAFNRSRPLDCDVDTFEQALAAASGAQPAAAALPHLQRAVAAYGGDFLAETAAGDWAQARRNELRRAFENALLATGRLHAAAGRHQQAAAAFRRLIAHEPLNETGHRELMSAWAALGETARAVAHYTELSDLLAEQVGVPPAAETTALYRRLLRTGQVTGQVTGRREHLSP